MAYIDDYGKASGPIKIRNIWMQVASTESWEDNTKKERHAIVFSQSKKDTYKNSESEYLAPLIAGTPVFGIDANGKEYAPENSVVTIKWLKNYVTFSAGQNPFNPDMYASVESVRELQEQVEKNTSNINLLLQRTSALEALTKEHTSAIIQNQNNINKNAQDIKSHQENPFPNGVIFICGGATIDIE